MKTIMKLDLTIKPHKWDGNLLVDLQADKKSVPSTIRDLLLEALAEANTAGFLPTGQPLTADPSEILARAVLSAKIGSAEQEVDLMQQEIVLLEKCISSGLQPVAGVPAMAALHGFASCRATADSSQEKDEDQ